ncbi:hypothetical protein D1B33_03395 [Lysinibacillus yapensis]|uniref:Uncharacterized protein n=1 Tax=Ureibacillus yapensis TaxID=2304605 RepID=A0A396SF40_9BACL|nr:hypothetical protein [Lysinibacillus yapensis]RHW39905.1 hypothetical protein D1B33_03395 [Lysinibacillus yapensis]
MVNVHKAAVGSFFLPFVTALLAIYMPNVQSTFNVMIMAVFAVNIMSYIVLLSIFKKKKRQNASRIVILFNMLAFCLFFTFPLLKALNGKFWMQIVLFIIFCICIGLAIYDQKREVPLVFPPDEKERRKYGLVFYLIPVFAGLIAGGGNIIVVRTITDIVGDWFVTYVGGISLYVLGCWFAFFFQSLSYQGFTKNGLWVK